MTLFSIYSKPDAGPEAVTAVPERFVWMAFLFPPLWALAKRAWGFLLVWLVVAVALFALQGVAGLAAVAALYGVFALWCGFAAPAIAARALERSGWMGHGELVAPNVETAEHIWLSRLYGARP